VPKEVVTKDPGEVIHEADTLEAYLDAHFQRQGITFEQWVGKFGGAFYRSRNETVLALVAPIGPRRVFEFACSAGFLAQLLLDRVATIERYVCSNFSSRMIEYCRRQLQAYSRCEVKLIDVNVRRAGDLLAEELASYDLFVTTSLEHIQFDRELIAELPAGAHFVFSVASFDDPEHFRFFEDSEQLRSRYEDLLEFVAAAANPEGNKHVVLARRRGVAGSILPRDHE